MRMLRKKHHYYIVTFIFISIILAGAVTWFAVTKRAGQPSPQNETSTHQPQNQNVSPDQKQLACIAKLPLETVLGQKIMVAAYKDTIAAQGSVLWAHTVNGVIIMNAAPASSIKKLVTGFRIKPTIAVDQEGGSVQRYTEEGVLPGASDITKQTPQIAYQAYKKDSDFLSAIGITTNFGPVVDVQSKEPSPLPGRMYGSDATIVINYAKQFILATQTSGVTPVMKHFPGLGSASGNTDFSAATTDPLKDLQTRDVLPYQKLAPLQADVMVSNAITPDLTDGQPAIWSKAAIDLLRSYGYQQSVVYTDSLTAEAISGTIEDAAIKTWLAGTDVALVVQKQAQTSSLDSILSAILTRAEQAVSNNELQRNQIDQSVARILARKQVDACSLTP